MYDSRKKSTSRNNSRNRQSQLLPFPVISLDERSKNQIESLIPETHHHPYIRLEDIGETSTTRVHEERSEIAVVNPPSQSGDIEIAEKVKNMGKKRPAAAPTSLTVQEQGQSENEMAAGNIPSSNQSSDIEIVDNVPPANASSTVQGRPAMAVRNMPTPKGGDRENAENVPPLSYKVQIPIEVYISTCSRRHIRKQLECQACKDFAISPIYTCPAGHVVCRLCFEVVKTCSTCGGGNQPLSPNGLADRLAVEFHNTPLPCKYVESGCQQRFTSTTMFGHLGGCDYRPVKCFESVECRERSVELRKFYKHLLDDHECPTYQPIAENSRIFHVPIEINDLIEWSRKLALAAKSQTWGSSCIQFDGKEFVLRIILRDNHVHWWLTVIGGEAERQKYVYNTKILAKEVAETAPVQCDWVIPVLPIRDYYDFATVKVTGQFAGMHVCSLKKFCRQQLDIDHWTVLMEIKKKEPTEEQD